MLSFLVVLNSISEALIPRLFPRASFCNTKNVPSCPPACLPPCLLPITNVQALRVEHQRLALRLVAKRQQLAQQRGYPLAKLLADQWIASALGEVFQIRTRIQQLEASMADVSRTAGLVDALEPGGAGAYPANPLMHLFGPSAATSSESNPGAAAAFPPHWQQAVALGGFQGATPFFGMPSPMFMPVVPAGFPTGAAAVSGQMLAAAQVPLHHHQLAAAAAAAAASAATAAMFGSGILPNGGGMYFMPQPVQQQQAATAGVLATEACTKAAAYPEGAASGTEHGVGAPGASTAASSAPPMSGDMTKIAITNTSSDVGAATVVETEILPKEGDAQAESKGDAAAATAQQTGSAAEASGKAPAGGTDVAEPAVAAAVPAGTDARDASGEPEDPQEAIRRVRLQRFAQQS